MSAKMTKNIQRSKAGEKNTKSDITKGKGNIAIWNKISTMAQINTPSFKLLPQQHVLHIQHRPQQHMFQNKCKN